jgi:hypothetical protein
MPCRQGQEFLPQVPVQHRLPIGSAPPFDAPTVVKQKQFVKYLEHRMRTFQGTFHASPDYALWYGWSEMQRDLTEINELAGQMRRNKMISNAKP